jgi:cytochrome b involved in lipid metabolism
MKSRKFIYIGTSIVILLVAVLLIIFITRPNESSSTSFSNSTEDTSANNSNQTASKPITIAEVSTHNTKNDCWTIINGKVYDITDYINSHPGGDEILRACGIDGSTLFNSRTTQDGQKIDGGGSHSVSASRLLDRYEIGELQQ